MRHLELSTPKVQWLTALANKAASNESQFRPPAWADPAFATWAQRVSMKVLNLPNPSPPGAITRVYLSEGVPSAAWAEGYGFLLSLERAGRGRIAEGDKPSTLEDLGRSPEVQSEVQAQRPSPSYWRDA